jgi:hypothetical protein
LTQDTNDEICVKRTLEKILYAQRKAENRGHSHCETSCEQSIDKLIDPSSNHSKNSIPFILYCACEPFKVEGATTFFDHCSKKEKFFCFTTFIFRIKDLKGDCAILELLKFDCHETCVSNSTSCNQNCICSPCCQLHCQDVDDLIPTGVCITVDLSCFCAIQCLPAVCL